MFGSKPLKDLVPDVLVFAFLAFCFSFYVFFPGLMGNDSIYQYGQMKGVFPVSNTHPPMMIWVWRALDAVSFGAAGPLFLQTFLYWLAMALLAGSLGATRAQRLGLMLLGFFPPVYNMSLHIYKDGMLLVFWMMSVACSASFLRQKKLLYFFGAIVFCLLGIFLRHNAWLAGAVLIAANVHWLCRERGWTTKILSPALTAAVLGVAIVLSGFMANYKVSEKRNLPQLLAPLQLWDLYHMSLLMDRNIFPVQVCGERYAHMSEDQVLSMLRALSPADTAVPVMYECMPPRPGVPQSFQVAGFSDGWLLKYWARMVLRYPGSYLQHRIRAMGWFFSSSSHLYHNGIAPNDLGIRLEHPGLVKGWLFTATFLARPLYHGLFWVVLLSCMLWGACFRAWHWGDQASRELVMVLSLSGLLYFIPLFVLIWSPDYRYMLWTVFAGSLSLGIFFCRFRIECHRKS